MVSQRGLATLLISRLPFFYGWVILACVCFAGFARQGPAFASSIANLAQMAGLVALPLIAHVAIERDGWRAGWLAVGVTVLLVGFVPNWLFMVRRPEDVGLLPDRLSPASTPGRAGAESPR